MPDRKGESSDDCPTQGCQDTPSTDPTDDKVHDKRNGTEATVESVRNFGGTNARKSDIVVDGDKSGLDSDDTESDATVEAGDETKPSEKYDIDSDVTNVVTDHAEKSKVAAENIVDDTSRCHGDTASDEVTNDASRATAGSSRDASHCDADSNCCKSLHDSTRCGVSDAKADARAVLMTCLSGDAVSMVAKLTDAQVVAKCVDTLKKLFPDEVGHLYLVWYARYGPLL